MVDNLFDRLSGGNLFDQLSGGTDEAKRQGQDFLKTGRAASRSIEAPNTFDELRAAPAAAPADAAPLDRLNARIARRQWEKAREHTGVALDALNRDYADTVARLDLAARSAAANANPDDPNNVSAFPDQPVPGAPTPPSPDTVDAGSDPAATQPPVLSSVTAPMGPRDYLNPGDYAAGALASGVKAIGDVPRGLAAGSDAVTDLLGHMAAKVGAKGAYDALMAPARYLGINDKARALSSGVDAAVSPLDIPPEFREGMDAKIASNIGMMGGIILTGWLGKGAQGTAFIAQGFDSMADRVKAKGGENTVGGDLATLGGGAVTGLLGNANVQQLLEWTPPTLRSAIADGVLQLATKAGKGAALGAVIQLNNNIAIKLGVDPKQALGEGVGESAAVMGLSDLLMFPIVGGRVGKPGTDVGEVAPESDGPLPGMGGGLAPDPSTLHTDADGNVLRWNTHKQAARYAVANELGGSHERVIMPDGTVALQRRAVRPTGVREEATAAAPQPTPEDVASPLDTDLVTEGKRIMADAEGASKADALLRENGAPPTGSRVLVNFGTRKVEGVVEDAFVTDHPELGKNPGIKIKLADGTTFDEHFSTIRDAGISIDPIRPAPAAEPAPEPTAAPERGPGTDLAPVVGPSNLHPSLVDGLLKRGFSQAQARGIAAGITAESRGDPNVRGGYQGRALGIGQWLGARRDEIIKRYGEAPTLDQQLDFLAWELRGGDSGGKSVLGHDNEVDVLHSYITDFMRPAKGHETTGDIQRGLAALGRKGDILATGDAAPSSFIPGSYPQDDSWMDGPARKPDAALVAAAQDQTRLGDSPLAAAIEGKDTAAPGDVHPDTGHHRGDIASLFDEHAPPQFIDQVMAIPEHPMTPEWHDKVEFLERRFNYQPTGISLSGGMDVFGPDGQPTKAFLAMANGPANDAADGSTAAADTPTPPTIGDTPGGKGLVISGAAEPYVAAIKAALPVNASLIPNKDGDLVVSKKHEEAVRAAVEAVTTSTAPAATISPLPAESAPASPPVEAGATITPIRVYHGGPGVDGDIRAPFFMAPDHSFAQSYADERGRGAGKVEAFDIRPTKIAGEADIADAARAVGLSETQVSQTFGGALLDEAMTREAPKVVAELRSRGFDAATFHDFAVNDERNTKPVYVALDPAIVSRATETPGPVSGGAPAASVPAAGANTPDVRHESERAAAPKNPGTIQQMPGDRTVKDAKGQGWNAAESGWSIDDNPYIATSSMSDAWRSGFRTSDKVTQKPPAAEPVTQAPAARTTPTGPLNLFQFIKSLGGMKAPTGHNLTSGSSRSNAGSRGLHQRLVGLIDKNGVDADHAFDAAVEAGYFGHRSTGEVTEAEFLDALENADQHYRPEDAADIRRNQEQRRSTANEQARRFDLLTTAEQELGVTFTDADRKAIMRLILPEDTDAHGAIEVYTRERGTSTVRALSSETGDPFYDIPDLTQGKATPHEYDPFGPQEAGTDVAQGGDGQAGQAGDARGGEANRPPDAQGSGPPAAGEARPADVLAPRPDDQRTALERQAEGRKGGTGPQKAAGSDGGLFDVPDTTGDLFGASAGPKASSEGPKASSEGPRAEDTAREEPASDYGKDNKTFTRDAYEAAKARMRERMNRLNAGFDPQTAFDGLLMAGFHVEAGARKFADYAQRMVDDLGPKIIPHLRQFYESVRHDPNAAELAKDMSGPEEIGAALARLERPEPARPAESAGPVANAVRDRLLAGDAFSTIAEARKMIADITGERVEPGTAGAKKADEAVEAGVVLAARSIAAREAPPLDTYRALVDLYSRQPSLNVRTSTSVEQQAYSTPVPLAYLASHRAGITQQTTVYEPSAGNGALLIDARATYAQINELNPDRAAALRSIFKGATITTEDASRFVPPEKVDAVIANPPFGAVRDANGNTRSFDLGRGYQTNEIDHAIALKALEAMKADGRAVLIVGSIAKTIRSDDARSDAYNGRAKREFYLRLYGEYNVTDHFTVAGELYAKQGAGWPVDVIVIEGRGKSALRVPAADVPRQYDSWDGLEAALDGRPSTGEATRQPAPSVSGAGAEPQASDAGSAAGGGGLGNNRRGGLDQNGDAGTVREGSAAGQPGGGAVDGAAAPAAVKPASDNGAIGADRPTPVRRAAPPVEGANARQVGYAPASSAKGLGTLVPVNMQTAIRTALDTLQSRVGPVDGFVADRLGYSKGDVSKYFAAEQVDALALALDNMERGSGFIIGDQTGIGKGRVVAGVIRYAIKSGRTPIFVTEKPNLYGDMYRDMADIGLPDMLGRPVDILMTNAAQRVPLDDEGKVVLKTPAAAAHNAALMKVAQGAKRPDVIFTTYDQMTSYKGEQTSRQAVLKALVPGSIVIFDESHNAGGGGPQQKTKKNEEGTEVKVGAPNRAEFARELAADAHGVFFSSATYAKRPDVMDLYSSTDMKLAVADVTKLGEAISKGGIPMQQVVASNLAESGQYVRRERSFDGVEYNTPVVSIDRKAYSDFTQSLQAIQTFSEQHVAGAVKGMDRDLKADGKAISGDNSTGGAGASSTNFTAILHNLVDQMLLAMKADTVADRAIAAIKSGEKPVITVANTMGAFLQEYAEANGIKSGDTLDLDFRDLLLRYLKRTRVITIRKPFSSEKGERHTLTDAEIGPEGVAAFHAAGEQIRGLGLGHLPLSPIDHIKTKLAEAGYSVGEITGRTVGLDYSGGTTTFRTRPGSESSIAGRRRAVSGFNGGSIDAMLLNQAGSTGLSLHAGEKFKDQRPRRMIIAQAEKNIDTHMQMLGRIHRSGQVVLPRYDQVTADVPAEKRPTAVLAKKMASLNANTTGARDSALTSADVPDFMNQYGDEIAARIMEESDDLHYRLARPLKDAESGDGLSREDAARKVTGRLVLLPLADQEEFYDRFLDEYQAYVAEREAAGENILEAKTLELDARPVKETVAIGAISEGSPFGAAVTVSTMDVKRLGKPFKPEQVLSQIADAIEGDVPEGDPQAALEKLRQQGEKWQAPETTRVLGAFDDYSREVRDSIEDGDRLRKVTEAHRENRNRFRDLTSLLVPGRGVRIQTENGALYGIVTNLVQKGKAKNPIALSTWSATVALADSARQITVPLSQLDTKQALDGPAYVSAAERIGDIPLLRAFSEMQVESRENRTIITGNILAGFDHVSGKGQIINFVDHQGDIRPGILMPRTYDYAAAQAKANVQFRTTGQVVEWLNRGFEAKALGVTVKLAGPTATIETPASKQAGGKFYLSAAVRAITGDFVKVGNNMRATVTRGNVGRAVDALRNAGATFTATTDLDEARKLVGEGADLREGDTGTSPVTEEQAGLIRSDLAKRLAKVDPQGRFTIEAANGLLTNGQGAYDNRIIYIALDRTHEPVTTMYHELGHGLYRTGLLTAPERTSLEKEAEKRGLMTWARQLYGDKPDTKQREEAAVEMVARELAARTEPKGFVGSAVRKVRGFIEAVVDSVRERVDGTPQARQIMRDVESGKVGDRSTNLDRRLEKGAVAYRAEDPSTPGTGHEFEGETEERFQAAKEGLGDGPGLISKARDAWDSVKEGITRHWKHLPNEPRFADLQQQLRKLEAAGEASTEEAVRRLTSLVKGFTKADLDLFTRKVVLDDLQWEVSKDHKLPFGFTPDSLAAARVKVDAAVAGNEKIEAAVRNRKLLNQQLADDMVASDVLTREQIKNPAYYRHMVLEFARLRRDEARSGVDSTGKKVRSPYWAKRMGSELDINANLLEAEFDWMHKALVDIQTAKTIEWIKKSSHNIREDLRAQAKASNKGLVDALVAADTQPDGTKGPIAKADQEFRQLVGRGMKIVADAINAGDLDPIPRHLRAAAEAVANGTRGGEPPFALMAWIMDNEKAGKIGAGMVLKGVGQRKAWTRKLLGDKYHDPENMEGLVKAFAPEGYKAWQPVEGRHFFTAKTVTESALDMFVGKLADTNMPGVDHNELAWALSQIRQQLVVGGDRYTMVLPSEVADTLTEFGDRSMEGALSRLAAGAQGKWKIWQLINPRRVLKYNLNNLSGDLDAMIAGNPRALLRSWTAAQELYNVMAKGAKPSAAYAEAVERGVFSSGLSIQEIPDINRLSALRHLTERSKRPDKMIVMGAGAVWRGLKGFTQFRENIFRYAAYLEYKARLDAGDPMSKVGYGASIPNMVDAVTDNRDKAALLARDLVGDYGAISVAGRWLRKYLIPFFSWQEINTKRYWRLTGNAFRQSKARGFATGGALGAGVAARVGVGLFIRIALLNALLYMWNNLVFGDDEKKLGEAQRNQMHLLLGHNADGEVRSIRLQGALSDALGVIGFWDAVAAAKKFENGQGSLGDVAKETAKGAVNHDASGLSPFYSIPLDLLTGTERWPDMFHPRQIHDRGRYVAKSVSLDNEYDQMVGNPTRGYARSWTESLVYKRDPGEMAYDTAKSIAYDWLERVKGESGGGRVTPRGEALRNYRMAMRYEDQPAAIRALEAYAEAGGTLKDIKTSIKRQNPLGPIPKKDRAAFVASLTQEQIETFMDAEEYYNRLYGVGQ